jgi:hypothetical protein
MMTATPYVPKWRVSTWFRRVRELRGSRASWTLVESGPTSARTWGLVGLWATVAICVAALAGWFGVLVRQTGRWENLRSRGRTVSAYVIATYSQDNGNGGSDYYLATLVDACECNFTVKVTTLDGHPFGSRFPIRYDPQDHSNVVPLVDRPGSTLGIGIAAFVAVLLTGVVIAASWLRKRRRSKALVYRSSERRAVTFRACQRQFGDNKQYFLLLFDAATGNQGDPICCVPVLWLQLRRLRDDDVLLLHGNGGDGSVALRGEGTVILPSGPAKPGRWEHSLRGS